MMDFDDNESFPTLSEALAGLAGAVIVAVVVFAFSC